MQQAKIKPTKAFSQFELTQNLLQNLNNYNLGSTAKLVLLYLSSCYNPKHADMFPKQKTIASKLGISERSVVRAIQELVNEHLIIIECKFSNHYKFTSKIVSYCPTNLSDDLRQDDIKQDDKLAQSKPTNEPINEPLSVEDYKILKNYAIKHGAKNIQAYVNKLISSGSAKDILKEHKAIQNKQAIIDKKHAKLMNDIQFAKDNCANELPTSFFKVKEKLKKIATNRC